MPPATRTAGATRSATIAAAPLTRPRPRPPIIMSLRAMTWPRGLQVLPGQSCGHRARGRRWGAERGRGCGKGSGRGKGSGARKGVGGGAERGRDPISAFGGAERGRDPISAFGSRPPSILGFFRDGREVTGSDPQDQSRPPDGPPARGLPSEPAPTSDRQQSPLGRRQIEAARSPRPTTGSNGTARAAARQVTPPAPHAGSPGADTG